MGGDANGNYCSFMAVTIHLSQLLFIRVDCIVNCLGEGSMGGVALRWAVIISGAE